MVERIEVIAREHDLLIGTFGHAGDGHLHVNILADTADKSFAESVYLLADSSSIARSRKKGK
jgi:glycolate oxidase